MTNQPGQVRPVRAFVLRVVSGDQGGWRGQASEPGSPDEWHETFASLEEFWAGLQRRLAVGPPPPRPLGPRD